MHRSGEMTVGALLVHEQQHTRKLTIMLFHGTPLLEITPACMDLQSRDDGKRLQQLVGSLHVSAHIFVSLFMRLLLAHPSKD